MPAKAYPKRFNVSHSRGAKFSRRGLRGYFEYRDLGIAGVTRGKVVAHVIRARPGKAPHGDWHWHDVDVQFVYVLKGSAVFEYEGIGRVTMKPGTCFYQPPRILHREIRAFRIYDGPTEVHKWSLAKKVKRDFLKANPA